MLGGSEFDATLLEEECNGARGGYTLRLKYRKLLSPHIFFHDRQQSFGLPFPSNLRGANFFRRLPHLRRNLRVFPYADSH
jgi:hypothetical protein